MTAPYQGYSGSQANQTFAQQQKAGVARPPSPDYGNTNYGYGSGAGASGYGNPNPQSGYGYGSSGYGNPRPQVGSGDVSINTGNVGTPPPGTQYGTGGGTQGPPPGSQSGAPPPAAHGPTPTDPTGQGGSAPNNLESQLMAAYGNSGPAGSFNYQAYQPGALPTAYQGSPFQNNYQTTAAPTYTPTNFSGGSFDPGAAFQGKQFTAPTNQAQPGLLNQVQAGLANPSRYDSQQAIDTFNRLRQNLDQSYGTDKQIAGEEMARRGLGDSTVYGGRLGDLAIRHGQDLGNLAQNVSNQQAQTYASDRAKAVADAMGYGEQQYGQAYQTAGFNQNVGQTAFQDSLARAGLLSNQSQFNAGLGASQAATGFANRLASAGFNANQNQQGFQNAMQTNQVNNLLGQQGYENALTGATTGAALQGQGYNQALGGFNANQNAQLQASQLKQQNLQNVFGYGQQQFQNQMSTQQENDAQSAAQWQQYMQMMGMTAPPGANG